MVVILKDKTSQSDVIEMISIWTHLMYPSV